MFETNGIKTNNNLVKNELLNAFFKSGKNREKTSTRRDIQ